MENVFVIPERFLGDGNSLNVRRIKYRKSAELHSHEFYEMEYITSGSGIYMVL